MVTEGLTLTTPSLLFSAISLILLAYTNRFLSYASVVRNLKDKYESDPQKDTTSLAQIRNFVKRLQLIRAMQILGAGSLLFCITAMFFIYIGQMVLADWIFGAGMVMLAASLVLCIWEIQISVDALELHLNTIRERTSRKNRLETNERSSKEAPQERNGRNRRRGNQGANRGEKKDGQPEQKPSEQLPKLRNARLADAEPATPKLRTAKPADAN